MGVGGTGYGRHSEHIDLAQMSQYIQLCILPTARYVNRGWNGPIWWDWHV